ncbi:TIGR02594 family protein [Neorhizobium galegae bv. officinalis]|uniref:TIGR02594 family protein n=1 Tax=Neorhizobium galegae bv. officinalis TaxID=323656 RepID=A0A0T7FB83_NEOGA|nr:TIGR02594 family protein [Neorhizobium galegae]CDZ32193.1 TIGR02594 family protein [Neorhizobium galegae bv. officinalis]
MQSFDGWVIERLRAHGAYAGILDNAPGRAMIDGLKKFQQAEGLDVTGMADEATVHALRRQGNSRESGFKVLGRSVPVPREPIFMREARRYLGIKEVAGAKANPTIIGFAKALGGWVASYYTSDETPWCGLGLGYCIAATLPNEVLPSNPLSALAWKNFGMPLTNRAVGAILVFVREGGGHVGFYVGEDDICYHVLGFNQSNSVTITRVEKSRCVAIRWPKTSEPPIGGPVFMTATAGVPISRNEA